MDACSNNWQLAIARIESVASSLPKSFVSQTVQTAANCQLISQSVSSQSVNGSVDRSHALTVNSSEYSSRCTALVTSSSIFLRPRTQLTCVACVRESVCVWVCGILLFILLLSLLLLHLLLCETRVARQKVVCLFLHFATISSARISKGCFGEGFLVKLKTYLIISQNWNAKVNDNNNNKSSWQISLSG